MVCDTSSNDFRIQEEYLLNLLKDINFESVFEIGCGWGRITKLILDNFKTKTYHACDISPDRAKLVGIDVITKPFQEIEFNQKYDLVIAVEVLMHIPPEEIKQVIDKIYMISKKHIVTLDYFPKGQRVTNLAPFNFIHEYKELFTGKVNHKYINSGQSIFHIEL